MQASVPRPSTRLAIPGAWMSGALLFIMLMALATSLRIADWADGIALLTPIILLGFIVGVALSYSHWNGFFPILYSLVVGVAVVIYYIGQSPEVPLGISNADKLIFMGNSLWSWGLLLFSREPARSNLVFLLQLGLLLWWLSYLAAWAVFREGRVWRAIIPIGLVMLVNTYFGPSGLGLYFVVFAICALLLAARSFLSEKEIGWRIDGIRYADDIQLDFLRDGLILALLVVGLAVLLPTANSNGALDRAVQPLTDPWRDVQAQWGRLFSSLNYRGARAGEPAFGDTLTLGGPRNLTDRLIMDVSSNAGRYWRAAAYTTFTGNRWVNTAELTQDIDAATSVQIPAYAARSTITQTITMRTNAGNVLFAAGQPAGVSLKATADLYVLEPDAGNGQPLAEIAMMHRRDTPLRSGDKYLAVSQLSTATIEDLQEAGTQYPAWTTPYLETPSDLSPQVQQLAQQIAAGLTTPYDQAVAIEQYLRGFTYNDQISAPPEGVNAVNYFLFDIRQGYCDYYASSFAMLARSLGIPARVAAGYSQGTYDPNTGAFAVRENNGHAWPEVYFPNYGWVEFEPTAAEDEIVRSHRVTEDTTAPTEVPTPTAGDEDALGPTAVPDNTGAAADADAAAAATANNNRRLVLIALALILAVGIAAVYILRRRRGAQGPSAAVLLDPLFTARLYAQLIRWAQRLGLPLQASQTPHEHATTMATAVPEGRTAIQSITDLYVEDMYSPRAPNEGKAVQAWTAWNDLIPMLRQAWVRLRFRPAAALAAWVEKRRQAR
ncbi:MAG: transglutaminaseTgpA domain-containing protein [Anaerolineae bacterium]